jgi:hypothetical protein
MISFISAQAGVISQKLESKNNNNKLILTNVFSFSLGLCGGAILVRNTLTNSNTKDLKEENCMLKAKIQEQKIQISNLIEENKNNKTRSSQLEDLADKNEGLQEEIRRNNAQIRRNNAQIQELTEENPETSERLQSKIQEFREKNKALTKKLEEQKTQISTLTEDNKNLFSQLEDLKNKNEELQEKIQTNNNKIKENKNPKTSEELQAKIQELTTANEALTKKLEEQKKQISTLTEENKNNKTHSSKLEKIQNNNNNNNNNDDIAVLLQKIEGICSVAEHSNLTKEDTKKHKKELKELQLQFNKLLDNDFSSQEAMSLLSEIRTHYSKLKLTFLTDKKNVFLDRFLSILKDNKDYLAKLEPLLKEITKLNKALEPLVLKLHDYQKSLLPQYLGGERDNDWTNTAQLTNNLNHQKKLKPLLDEINQENEKIKPLVPDLYDYQKSLLPQYLGGERDNDWTHTTQLTDNLNHQRRLEKLLKEINQENEKIKPLVPELYDYQKSLLPKYLEGKLDNDWTHTTQLENNLDHQRRLKPLLEKITTQNITNQSIIKEIIKNKKTIFTKEQLKELQDNLKED